VRTTCVRGAIAKVGAEVSLTACHSVDVLIVGGGINGAGIARDAAGRGLDVALVEQADLASATSSSSTKLIHGGLRYLEFMEFGLVRQALIERERLLGIAPHLIRPMQFILPHVPGLRPRWLIRLGLFIYDHVGGRRSLPSSHAVRLDALGEPVLRSHLRHGFSYSDCRVDDSRLVICNALDAMERGASILTHTRLVSAQSRDGLWHARCEDGDGRKHELRARALVNAAGPWVERVRALLPVERGTSHLRLVKGSHIVVPRLFEGTHAFMLQNADGRIVFTIPYEHDWTLVGTTDVRFEGNPAAVHITPEETGYLCDTVNRYFRRAIGPGDVRWSYAGVRPLLDDESPDASRVTRDYRLELTDGARHPPLLTIYGGKITTYRRLAEAALEMLRPHVGGARHGWTDRATLPGGDLPRADFEAFLQDVRRRWPFLGERLSLRLAHAYGTRIERILGTASAMDDLGEHYGAGLTAAELDYLRSREWARDPDDVLWRRTKLGLHLSEREQARVAAAMGADTEVALKTS